MSSLRYTSVKDTPEMVQAKLSNKLSVDVSLTLFMFSMSHFLDTAVKADTKKASNNSLVSGQPISYV